MIRPPPRPPGREASEDDALKEACRLAPRPSHRQTIILADPACLTHRLTNIKTDRNDFDTVSLESYSSDRTVRQSGGHESFIPAPVNHGWTWEDARIHTLLEETTGQKRNRRHRFTDYFDLFA